MRRDTLCCNLNESHALFSSEQLVESNILKYLLNSLFFNYCFADTNTNIQIDTVFLISVNMFTHVYIRYGIIKISKTE